MSEPERSSSRPIDHFRPVLVGLVMMAALASVIGELGWNGGVPLKAAEPETAAAVNEAVPAKRVTEKQIKAYSGLAALAGIVIVGLALAALIVLWAGRLRRQIRRPARDRGLPERDFWFLKPPKPTVTQSSLPDAHQPPHQSPDEPDSKNDV